MLGIFKPQFFGYFRDGFPFQEHLPGLLAAQVMDTVLTPEEITHLETLADATGIDTSGDWEHTME